MNTLAEIETAADALPPEQKQELILFLATRLRKMGFKLPQSRKFTPEQMQSWIAADEEDMRRFRDQGDFAGVLGHSFYDLAVLRPGVFLQRERAAGRLKV